jgi:YidC/Oxa1 family membrane protein insertase
MPGFLNAPVGAAYLIVTTIAHVLTTPLGAGLATAAAIIVFTAAVRLLLSPLSYHAFRGQARMSALQPRLAALRARYAHQPDRLQQELAALYRAEGGGMLAGCLPMLLQLPFFSVMYRLFLSGTVDGHANGLLTRDLLTTPLGSHWLTGAGPFSVHGLAFLAVFALLAGAAYLAVRVARTAAPPAAGSQAAGSPAATALLTRILPYTTVVIAAFVPLAAGLYLLTTTAWTAAERAGFRWWTTSRAGRSRSGAAIAAGS